MATRFWVGGTGTWDAADTTHWAATTGGAGGQSVPGSADTVTFDGSSGGGTATVNATITVVSIDLSSFTGTLDFATNNNNVTLSASTSALINVGSSTRTFNMGNGTWTLSGAQAIWNMTGATNLTFNANSSTIAFTGTATALREFRSGTARTYNIVTVNSSVDRFFQITATTSLAINTLTITGPNRIYFPQAVTTTVTTLSNISGNSTNQCILTNTQAPNGQATISSANNFVADYCAISGLAFTGGGTFTATNSFNVGQNTGITITLPSGGGGAGAFFGA